MTKKCAGNVTCSSYILSPIVVLTPNGQFLGYATIAVSELYVDIEA